LHIKGTLAFLIVLVPAMIYGAFHGGAQGVAYVWFAMNIAQTLVWVSIVHRRFMPGINADWYKGLAARVAAAGSVGIAFHYVDMSAYSRVDLFVALLIAWLSMIAAVVAVSPISHRKVRSLAGRLVFNQESG
jgi:hypothetical protein